MTAPPDLDLTRDALATSTLSHGLKELGDRWTVQILLSAFLGVRRFDALQQATGMPRRTLSDRLQALVRIGVLRPRPYQEKPLRHAYHLTRKGLGLYESTLMVWAWEKRWGTRSTPLPDQLLHKPCGRHFTPELVCEACGEKVRMEDLDLSLVPNPRLPHERLSPLRTPRMSGSESAQIGLGLRVDRWCLMIITAVVLGCHHFDQLQHVLRIGPTVLARRLSGMVEAGLLQSKTDRRDARRRIYRLTPSSRDLFGYIVSLTRWVGEHHLHEASAIRPRHRHCLQPFEPRVTCDHCHQALSPWDVDFETAPSAHA